MCDFSYNSVPSGHLGSSSHIPLLPHICHNSLEDRRVGGEADEGETGDD